MSTSNVCLEEDEHFKIDCISALQTFVVHADLPKALVQVSNVEAKLDQHLGSIPEELSAAHSHWLVAVAVMVSVIVLIVLIREIGIGIGIGYVAQTKYLPGHCSNMKIVELLRNIVRCADSTVPLPVALSLAQAWGWSVSASGFLSRFDFPGQLVGGICAGVATKAISYVNQRRLMISCIAFNAVLEVALSFLLTMPSIQYSKGILVFFITSRLITGFAAGLGTLNLAMTSSCLPKSENVFFGSTLPIACLVGGGFGPLVVKICVDMLPQEASPFQAVALPIGTMSVLQALVCMLQSLILPPASLESVKSADDAMKGIADLDVSVLTSSCRQGIAIQLIVTVAIAAFLMTCLLQAVPVLLHGYDWAVSSISAAVSMITFVGAGCSVVTTLLRACWFGTQADKALGTCLSGVSLLGAVLLFNFAAQGSAQVLVAGACLDFLIVIAVGGLIMGYGLASADDEHWYSTAVISNIIQNAGVIISFFAAPMARLVASVGRNVFAIFPLLGTLWIAGTFIHVRCYLMQQLDKHEEK